MITAGSFASMFKKNVQKGFIEGLSRVGYKKKWGFIDTKGNLLKDTWFQNAEQFVKIK